VHYYLEEDACGVPTIRCWIVLRCTPRLAVQLLDGVERIELRFLRDIERLA
jgi:hypothetical protein